MTRIPASPTVPTAQTTLHFLRIVQGIMLFSMVFYAIAAEVLATPFRKALDPVVFSALAVAAAALVGIAVWLQIARIRPALQSLQLKPDDPAALQRWRSATILACVMLEAVVLYGLSCVSWVAHFGNRSPSTALGSC